MQLTLYPESYSVCQLKASAEVPAWAWQGRFVSVSRTDDELSIVAASSSVPEGIKAEHAWRTFKLHGPFAFDEIGVIASLTVPLAKSMIGVFVISTFDTDYLLVKAHQLEKTLAVLKSNEHEITEAL